MCTLLVWRLIGKYLDFPTDLALQVKGAADIMSAATEFAMPRINAIGLSHSTN